MTDGSYVVAQKGAAGLVPNVKNPFAALVKVDIIKFKPKTSEIWSNARRWLLHRIFSLASVTMAH